MPFFKARRKNSQTQDSDRQDGSSSEEFVTRHCFVLCNSVEPPDMTRAAEVVAQVCGQDYSTELGETGIVVVQRGDQTVGFLAHMPAPIPNGEAEGNAEGNFLWPDGGDEAKKHQSHVIVTNMGGEESTPIESALAVTRLALVALELFDGSGVYWGNASVSNSRAVFEEFCENMSVEQLPVPIWLRFQLVSVDDEQVGLYTLGMRQFGLMDIEVDQCDRDVEDLFDFVANIAHYLITSGPVIEDGNTVGGSADERILVQHRPSMIEPDRIVYKIVFDE